MPALRRSALSLAAAVGRSAPAAHLLLGRAVDGSGGAGAPATRSGNRPRLLLGPAGSGRWRGCAARLALGPLRRGGFDAGFLEDLGHRAFDDARDQRVHDARHDVASS